LAVELSEPIEYFLDGGDALFIVFMKN